MNDPARSHSSYARYAKLAQTIRLADSGSPETLDAAEAMIDSGWEEELDVLLDEIELHGSGEMPRVLELRWIPGLENA